jgi:hypothetical protein
MSESGVQNTIPILQTATPLASAMDKPNILRIPPPTTNWHWIKILFLVLMIGLLGLNVYYYLTEGITFFAKMFGDGIKNTEEETKRGADAIKNALAEPEETEQDKTDDIESKEEIKSKLRQRVHKGKSSENIPKDVPSPDLSSHGDLKQKKKSYCYVGNQTGKRSCAEVEESDKCISGDIFPTESLCVNPNLRK